MLPRFRRLLFCLVALVIASRADTLQQLLEKSGVPAKDFTAEELAVEVSGAVLSDEQRVVVAYGQIDRLSGVALIGPRSVVKFKKASGELQRVSLPEDQAKPCGGSPVMVQAVDAFLLISTEINPSAGCTLVFDEQLRLQKTIYGSSPGNTPIRIGTAIVIIENMIHFAPVHPERLQLVDLKSWVETELYPARGDVLRRRLISKNAAHMPPRATCATLDEDCDPDFFDEEIRGAASDGKGQLAFVVTQTASHLWKEGEEPRISAAQTIFYLYQRRGSGWRYCQEELKEEELDSVSKLLQSDFAKATSGCVPSKVVFPDLRTQKYNPFISH